MAKRLQVILHEIQRVARARHMSLAEWVRQALDAVREEPSGSMSRKLDAIRTAVGHEFPTGDIDQILARLRRGTAVLARDPR